MAPSFGSSAIATMALMFGCNFSFRSVSAAQVDTKWYASRKNQVNDLETVPTASGVYGFIYNSSKTPDGQYGIYNWCNMPHVRRTEYVKPPSEYELKYVEVVSRRWIFSRRSIPLTRAR